MAKISTALPLTCCQCGMERKNWAARAGFEKEGAIFCCVRCAEERGCECEQVLRQQRLLEKPFKRPAPAHVPAATARPARG